MEKRPRDGARSKFNDVVMPEVRKLGKDFPTTYKMQFWLNNFRNTAWFRKRWESHHNCAWHVDVVCRSSVVWCTAQADPRYRVKNIQVAHTNVMDVLHILAHVLQPDDGTAWHGPGFSQTFFDLVRHEYNEDRVKQVRKIFTSNSIKTRTMSDEAKQAASERFKKRGPDPWAKEEEVEDPVADLLEMINESRARRATRGS